MGFLYDICAVLILMILRAITVLIHEFGHAVPIVLLTKDRVSVYIGTYGDRTRCFTIRTKRFDIWLLRNPLQWQKGCCIPHAMDITARRQFLFILAGPFASLVVAGLACIITFGFDLYPILKVFFVLLLLSAIFDLFINLIPRKRLRSTEERIMGYSDGYQLLRLIRNRRNPIDYDRAIELYKERKYAEAAVIFDAILKHYMEHEIYTRQHFRQAIHCYLLSDQFIRAGQLAHLFREKGNPMAEDFITAGVIKARLGYYEDSLFDFDESLELDPGNWLALCNRGNCLNILEEYEEALQDFDRAVELDPTQSVTYGNRGLAMIKLGRIEEGLKDIEYALYIDESNSEAYRNLGIYHFDRGELNEAVELFQRAKQLDPKTPRIDHYLEMALSSGIRSSRDTR
jgi:tetratricopeptide (TPR) repeat protein